MNDSDLDYVIISYQKYGFSWLYEAISRKKARFREPSPPPHFTGTV
jgi:hypothetical protein